MNLCKFNQSELTKFDQVIQRDLIKKNIMLERRVGCQIVGSTIFLSDSRWIKEAWKQETRKRVTHKEGNKIDNANKW